MLPVLTWIGLMSAVTFALTAWDKFRARAGHRRIPEARLLGMAFLGGSPGLIAAMLIFRHKTAKTSFQLAVGTILVLQATLLVGSWLLRN
jgi:uncharacterized membrane protein YsdA (DUF1294 family)